MHTEPTGSYIPSSIASSRFPGRGRPRRLGRSAAGVVIAVAVSTAITRTIEPLCSQARQVPHDQDHSAKDSLHRKTQKSQSADKPEVYSQNKLHMEKNMETRHIRSDITQKTNWLPTSSLLCTHHSSPNYKPKCLGILLKHLLWHLIRNPKHADWKDSRQRKNVRKYSPLIVKK